MKEKSNIEQIFSKIQGILDKQINYSHWDLHENRIAEPTELLEKYINDTGNCDIRPKDIYANTENNSIEYLSQGPGDKDSIYKMIIEAIENSENGKELLKTLKDNNCKIRVSSRDESQWKIFKLGDLK